MKILEKMDYKELKKYKGFSFSFIKNFLKAPYYAFQKSPPTDAMIIGDYVHKYLLEPEKLKNDFIINDLHRGTKEFKELKAANPDKHFLKSKDVPDMELIKKRLYEIIIDWKSMKHYIENGIPELSFVYEKETDEGNLTLKGKIDLYYEDVDCIYIFELKTCGYCPDFQKDINNNQYYIQDYIYVDAIETIKGLDKPVKHIYLVIEKKAPFGVMLYQTDIKYQKQGMIEIIKCILEHRKWVKRGSNEQELYPIEIKIVYKPRWLGTYIKDED